MTILNSLYISFMIHACTYCACMLVYTHTHTHSHTHTPTHPHTCSIYATRSGNTVLFHHEGGVEVGDVDAKANKVKVDIEDSLSAELAAELVSKVPQEKQK